MHDRTNGLRDGERYMAERAMVGSSDLAPRPPHLDVIHERIQVLGSNLVELREIVKNVCTRLLGGVQHGHQECQNGQKMAEKTGKLGEIEDHVVGLIGLTEDIRHILDQIQRV